MTDLPCGDLAATGIRFFKPCTARTPPHPRRSPGTTQRARIDSSGHGQPPRSLRPRPRRPRAQSPGRRRRHPPRRVDRVHRRLRLRKVVPRLRHDLRGGPAPLLRVGRAVRPPSDPPGGLAEGRRDRRSPSRGLAPAAPLDPHLPLLGGHGHQPLELAPDAVLPRGRLPARRRTPRLGRLLPEHGGGRVPGVPRPRPGPPHHRGVPRPRPLPLHPRGRDRRMAGRLAGQEPPGHPRHPRPRRGRAVARTPRRRAEVDPLHGRTAGGDGPPRPGR